MSHASLRVAGVLTGLVLVLASCSSTPSRTATEAKTNVRQACSSVIGAAQTLAQSTSVTGATIDGRLRVALLHADLAAKQDRMYQPFDTVLHQYVQELRARTTPTATQTAAVAADCEGVGADLSTTTTG